MKNCLSLAIAVSVYLAAVPAFAAAPPENVLLDFTATWCGPCRQMSPVVTRLERQGFPIRKVDVDQEPGLARKYGVQSIPTFVLVANGREVRRVVGLTSEDRLRNLLAQLPQNDPAPRAAESQPLASMPQAPSDSPRPRTVPFPQANAAPAQPRGESFADTAPNEPVIRAKHLPDADDRPMQSAVDPVGASVRIRVRDNGGVNYGSGTIVDSRIGRSLVLTCGHVFRELSSNARIEIDVFFDGRHETFVGKVVDYDLEADVGLCSLPTDTVLPVARVASLNANLAEGTDVFSIGCGGGQDPSRENLRVTALNRYLGPENVECTGVPMQGRSGGGLFNQDGELVGVCIAADRRESRGLYAGLKPVRELLQQAQTAVAQGVQTAAQSNDRAAEVETRPAAFDDTDMDGFDRDFAAQAAEPADPLETDLIRTTAGAAAGSLPPVGDAEVVCIIRSLNNPQAKSRVVIINRASSKFVQYLTDEIEAQPKPTSHTVRFEPPELVPAANEEVQGLQRYTRSNRSAR